MASKTDPYEVWLNIEEAVTMVKRSKQTIWRWASDGDVRSTVKFGRERRYNAGDLLEKQKLTRGRGIRTIDRGESKV